MLRGAGYTPPLPGSPGEGRSGTVSLCVLQRDSGTNAYHPAKGVPSCTSRDRRRTSPGRPLMPPPLTLSWNPLTGHSSSAGYSTRLQSERHPWPGSRRPRRRNRRRSPGRRMVCLRSVGGLATFLGPASLRLTCTFALVGKAGLEPAASASRTLRATKLRHFPETPMVVHRSGTVTGRYDGSS